MLLQPLAQKSKFELALNDQGETLLLHMGPLEQSYAWIQFDDYTGTVQLITESGSLQELGFIIPPPIKQAIQKARTVNVMEIGHDFICREHTVVVFNKVLT